MNLISGNYYHSGSAKASTVNCHVIGDTLMIDFIDEQQSSLNVHRDSLKVKSKLGSLPREIILDNGDLLVCSGDEPFNAWLDKGNESTVDKLESKKSWLVTSIVAVPICLYLLFFQVIPWGAVKMAAYVPYSVKQITSQQTLSVLDYSLLNPSELSEQDQDQILAGFGTVLTQMSVNHPHFEVKFRHSDAFGPNAFALPDGTIVFTDQLVNLVEQNQAILDAIFLHEVGHVEQNHSMQMVAESLVATLAISYIFGDLSGAVEAFMGVGSSVVHNKFSQAHEWQADEFALHHLQQLGRSTEDFADAMEKLKSVSAENSEYESWFETHPGINQRISNARNKPPGDEKNQPSDETN